MSNPLFWNGTKMTDAPARIVAESLWSQLDGDNEDLDEVGGWLQYADNALAALVDAGWGIYRKELVDKADAAWTLQRVRSGQTMPRAEPLSDEEWKAFAEGAGFDAGGQEVRPSDR